MKVLFDGYLYSLQGTGGINRYFSELIPRLPASVRPTIYGHQPSPLCPISHPRIRVGPPPSAAKFFQRMFLQWCGGFDLIHPTYYHLEPPLSWERIPGKVVLTVHDFVFAKYGHLYKKSSRLLEDQSAAIQRADQIICVSSSTRNDLLERFPSAEDRCSVIPLGASLPKPEKPFVNSGGVPYLLYVGSRVFYKNFPCAVETIVKLNQSGGRVDLVIGGRSLSQDELNLVSDLGASSYIRVCENPNDNTLAELYLGAIALIYPSLYEGFGLPPLEAMTLGTPVLGLGISSLPEVVGRGGVLIDPEATHAEAFAEAARRILEDDEFQNQLAEAAIAQASKFHWKRTAEETFAVYQRATA